MKTIFALATAFALVSTTAFAEVAADFAALDADASGDVSITEANTVFADLTAEVYAGADTNGDGKVSREEFDAFFEVSAVAE